ncbi:PGF-pre-PGF domain-containing protein [Halomicroarcula sp. S3CR25-11]|uniref:PGF-pre-PGF domain-containing protein n=1 Tax=Haloarcula onubensis TaxID=2950539 RepID=A0ABU2FIV9_9EURY|nr:PGF-pre-PGF domain-containing protein [Halomicroarcula sp. S3CR25-11]
MTGGDSAVTTRRPLARLPVVLVGLVVGLSLLAGSGVVGSAQAAAPDCSTVSFEGSGTAADPFRVETLDQLQCIGQTPGVGSSDGDYYELQNDIDASETATWNDGAGFEPLSGGSSFSGTIDGNGFVISNLSIDRPDERYVGLVGFFSDRARDNVSLERLHLESVDITGSESVGGLVGTNQGTVSDSSVSGSVTGTGTEVTEANVGGLAGSSSGDVRNSSSTASVDGSYRVGGLVGYVSGGAVNDSSSTGSVTGTDDVGGLVGQSEAEVRNASATGSVDGTDVVGGLVGLNRGDVNDSSAVGHVTGSERVGGLIGDNTDVFPGRGDVHNSSATGDVDGTRNVGGFVGLNRGGTLSASTAVGSVNGADDVGGFVGDNRDGTVSNASATGDVTGGESATVGGFIGANGGTVTTSSAVGSVTGDGGVVGDSSAFGGFVGYNDGIVNTSYATGDVTGGEFTDAGGFVGHNDFGATVNTSYATGSVSGAYGADVGGFVGENAVGAAVNESYSAGRVAATGTLFSLGGFAGQNDSSITTSYWDRDRSGEATDVDTGGGGGVTSLTTTEMEGSESETQMSDLFDSGAWTSVAGDYPDLVANPRTVSTPHFDAPSGSEMDTILADMATEGGDTIVMSDRALQAIHRDSAARSDDYRLGVDIDASGADEWNSGTGFLPIGYGSEFSGSLDGDGHVISNLSIDRAASDIGLFSVVTDGSTIERVGVESANVSGDVRVGGLVGENLGGTVRDSYVTGTVNGTSSVGGLVGQYEILTGPGGEVNESYAAANVTGSINIGGLIGNRFSSGTLHGSYATGSVDGDKRVGGLIGSNVRGTLQQTHATGGVNGTDNVGGLVGRSNDGAVVTGSYATGAVTGNGDSVGGLVGENTGGSTVNVTYATGSVAGGTAVGGLVGRNDATVNESYATGRVSGTDVGGAVGNDSGTVESVYWDAEATGQSASNGSAARYGLPTERMTGLNATVGLFEFDFEETWLPAPTPGGYPVLDSDSDFAGSADAYDGLVAGNGSAAAPYLITTVYELQLASVRLGRGESFELATDIDASVTADWFDEGRGPQGFEPLGNATTGFDGTFDGGGHVVTDLVVNRSRDNGTGLFGAVDSTGAVSDVGVESVTVTGNRGVGGLVGNNSGDVRNSSVSGRVDGNRSVGGLVGNSSGTVGNSSASGMVNASDSGVGGLIGHNYGDVRNSSADGRVDGTDYVGGLVGWSHGGATVSESYAAGNATGTVSQIGGAVGRNNGTVRRVAATGTVDGDGNVGGLVGRNLDGGDVTQSYATGAVVDGVDVGGLVGYNGGGTVVNTYATGAADGTNVGGLVGWNQGGAVRLSYATGQVNATSATVGGLVGYSSADGTIEDSYWDAGATNQSVGVSPTGGTVTGLVGFGAVGDGPASEMRGRPALDNVSTLDFTATWTAVDGYPRLSWSVDALAFTLATDNLTAGESTNAAVTLTLVDDATVGAATTSEYSSNDTGVATADNATVWATGAGAALLTAERAGVTDSAALSVVAAPKRPSSGGGSSGPSLELRVTDDETVEVTDARADSVVRISDETTGTAGVLGGGETVRIDALSVELATDRDFRLAVETFLNGAEGDADGRGVDVPATESRSNVSAAFEAETRSLSAGYVTVTHDLDPEDIENVTFEFSVREDRLAEFGVSPGAVALYRQSDGWTALPTDYLGTNGTEARFEATSPGFSSFAIGTGEPLTAVTAVTVADPELFVGETATVTATVDNRGAIAAERTLNLTANGTTVATETLALDAGETADVSLTFRPTAGEYAIAADGVRGPSLAVVAPPTPEPPTPAATETGRQVGTATTAATDGDAAGVSALGVLLVCLVAASGVGVLLWRRFR